MHCSFTGKWAEPILIVSFRTQQWPILHTAAAGVVMENWYSITASQITNKALDPPVRHALAVIVKTTVSHHVQRCVFEISE